MKMHTPFIVLINIYCLRMMHNLTTNCDEWIWFNVWILYITHSNTYKYVFLPCTSSVHFVFLWLIPDPTVTFTTFWIHGLSPFSCCNTPECLLTVRYTNDNSANQKHILWCLPTLYTITLQSKVHWLRTPNIFPEKPHYKTTF